MPRPVHHMRRVAGTDCEQHSFCHPVTSCLGRRGEAGAGEVKEREGERREEEGGERREEKGGRSRGEGHVGKSVSYWRGVRLWRGWCN